MNKIFSAENSLVVFYNAIRAMIYRELQTRFGMAKYGWVLTIMEPLLEIAFYVFLFALFRAVHISNINTVYFIGIAVINNKIFMSIFINSTNVLSSNRQLFYFPQIKPFTAVVAKAILEMITISLSMVTAWILSMGLTPLHLPVMPYKALSILIANFFLSLGLACIFSIVCIYFRWVQTILKISNRVIYVSSGLFYSTLFFNESLQSIFYINPLMISNEALRQCFYPNYAVQPPLTTFYLTSVMVLFIGLVVNSIYGKKVIGLGL